MWSRTHQPNWDLTNLGQNVNLNFQNDADDGDGDGDDAGADGEHAILTRNFDERDVTDDDDMINMTLIETSFFF